uniref:Uncharacterized protein n=1 Tax=Panagrolaimus sp. ES5 TaxID=591445 RepID=A0AC34G513_9BILA
MIKNPAKDYYVYIKARDESLHFIACDVKTQRPKDKMLKFSSGKNFVDGITKFFPKQFKVVILNIFKFKNHGYSSNYEFCKAIHEKFNYLKIPHTFISINQKVQSTILTTSKLTANIGDYVVILSTPPSSHDKYIIREYEFTEIGYEQRNCRLINVTEACRENIIGSNNPVKIVGYDIHPTAITIIKNLLKSENLIFIDIENCKTVVQQFICNMAKWIQNKNLNKFYVTPMTTTKYFVAGMVGDVVYNIITVDYATNLPVVKAVMVSKTIQDYSVLLGKEKGLEIIETEQLQKDCHKTKLTFKIDDEYFFSCTIKKVIIPEIQALLKTLDENQKEKIPVIGFWDNSSVICVSKNGGNYEFAEKWNGLYGKELFIYFNKPTFNPQSIVPFVTKMNTVVYDILKIISMPADNIQIDENWKFTFSKDTENHIMLEFDNFEGKREVTTPIFLMAMLLRQHLKAIKTETRGVKSGRPA